MNMFGSLNYLITCEKMEVRVFEAQNQIYQKEKLLGQGAFGKAYLVRKKQTNEMLVIKEVSIDHMTQQEREQTIKQAQILRNFNHPLIVKFVQVYATKNNKLKIVMEYAQCGDLSKAIANMKAQKKFFQQSQILDWFTQICLAMKHVHDRKILHRDIKGQNIFITKANTLKLGDFGIARVLNKTQDKARTVVGTPYYLSPQIIQNKPYSFKSDIWSMGVLLYELCALAPPFTANSLQFLALKIVKGSYTALGGNYSKQLKGLINQILQVDSNRRPSVGDILKKPFIQERIRKYLSDTYRKDQFSHTVLHNHKVQIANKLIKVQQDKQYQKPEQIANLKEKLDKKKQQEKQRDQERYRRKKQEEQQKRQEQLMRRKQQQVKNKQIEQRRAAQQRKRWIQQEKRKQQQQNKNYQQQERKRVYEIAQMARKRQREEQQLKNKKERLLNQKYQLEKERAQQMNAKKKIQKQKDQIKKMDQLNQFARKQWYQNQMIMKRAKERAMQAQIDPYSEPVSYQQEPKPVQRPQSQKGRDNSSRQSKQKKTPIQVGPRRNSAQCPQYEPSEEEIQNALLNPNYKKTPNSVKTKQVQKPSPNVSSWNNKGKQQIKAKDDLKSKKATEDMRQQMRKDRQQYLKNKNHIPKAQQQSVVETLKPGKWEKRVNKSNQKQIPKTQISELKNNKKDSPQKTQQESVMQSQQLRLDIKDEQQFKDYLNQLEGLLDNVNKNIQKVQILSELPVVEEKIIVRDDDTEDLNFSITASFDGKLKSPEVDDQNADFDYFSNYSKLQDLRMCLQDKFGTDNFVKIYRTIQKQLQLKGLQNFNILEVMDMLGGNFDVKIITQNLSLLLTLVVMEERINC